ncbi:MAG: nucleoside recognition domain-containing protein [Clostridiales bacterium]
MKREHRRYLLGFAAAGFFICMALFPGSIYAGARRGLDLWAGILVPAMLPFFILAEILMASGILRLLGRLLSPVMGPLFNLPGAGGLGIALGYTSGFPMGAVISSRLYQEGFLRRDEAGRLLAFTNNSSPGFLLTSLAAGMLGNPAFGLLFVLCHYGSNLIFGMILGIASRFPIRKAAKRGGAAAGDRAKETGWRQQAEEAKAAGDPSRRSDLSPSFSRIITESISSAIQSILALGGFVLLFAAALQLLEDLYLLDRLARLFAFFLPAGLYVAPLSKALATGFIELTLGLRQLTAIPLAAADMVTYCLIILGWSGLSIQAQVMGLAGTARLPLKYYLMGCIVQPLLSLLLLRFCLFLL